MTTSLASLLTSSLVIRPRIEHDSAGSMGYFMGYGLLLTYYKDFIYTSGENKHQSNMVKFFFFVVAFTLIQGKEVGDKLAVGLSSIRRCTILRDRLGPWKANSMCGAFILKET